MSNSIYKLYENLNFMDISDKYEILFRFNNTKDLGRTGFITITVQSKDTFERVSWVVSPKELEKTKMDVVKDHIEAMIESLEEDE